MKCVVCGCIREEHKELMRKNEQLAYALGVAENAVALEKARLLAEIDRLEQALLTQGETERRIDDSKES